MKRIFPLLLLPLVIIGCDRKNNESEQTEQPKDTEVKTASNQILVDSARVMTLQDLETNRNSYTKKKYELKALREVNFIIEDSTSDNFSYDPEYYEDENDQYFINYDNILNKTNIYSFNQSKLIKKLTTRDMPNKKWMFRRVYVHNLDSIFIYANNVPDLLLLDSSGAIKNIWQLPEYFNMYVGPTLYSYMFLDDNKMYLKYWLPNENAKTSDKEYFDSLTAISYDLETKEIERLGARYPKANTDSFHYQTRHIINQGHEKNMVTRFATLPLIYKTNIETNESKVFYVRSKYQDSAIAYAPVDEWGDIEDCREYWLKQNYKSVLYDKYRNVYYSIYSHETPLINPETGLKNDFDDIRISVIVTDTNFNIMGETLLDPNKYFRNYVVTKEGLMISNANGKNPNNKPNILSFTIFKLEEQ